jgi:two-component system sensor histidine kinase SenX3
MQAQTSRSILLEIPTENVPCLGNALHLRDALIQLIENGVKYSPENTPVTVSLKILRDADWVEVSVEDHGIGIEADDQAQLFHPFCRIKRDTNFGKPGIGLGLYIVKKVVDQHDGCVSLQSIPGKGSVFTISLPLNTQGHPYAL